MSRTRLCLYFFTLPLFFPAASFAQTFDLTQTDAMNRPQAMAPAPLPPVSTLVSTPAVQPIVSAPPPEAAPVKAEEPPKPAVRKAAAKKKKNKKRTHAGRAKPEAKTPAPPVADAPAKPLRKPLPENIETPRRLHPSYDVKPEAPKPQKKPPVKKQVPVKKKPVPVEPAPTDPAVEVSAPPAVEEKTPPPAPPAEVPAPVAAPVPPVPAAPPAAPVIEPPKVEAPAMEPPAPPVPAVVAPPPPPAMEEPPQPTSLPSTKALQAPAPTPNVATPKPTAPAQEKPKPAQAKAAPVTPVDQIPIEPPPGMEPVMNPTPPVVLGEMHKAPEAAPVVPPPPAPAADMPKPEGDSGMPDLRLVFKPTETAVPLSLKPELDKIATKLRDNATLHVVLLSYAASNGDQATMARRVSLSRALAVRAYLIDQAVDSKRINVQAEGDKNPGGEPDRVDVLLKSGE